MNKFPIRKTQTRFIFVFVVAGFLIFSINKCKFNEKWKIVWVVDGDTVIVKKGNVKEKIRLKGVDAPEIAHPEYKSYKTEYYGQQSKKYLINLLEKRTVTLQYDNFSKKRRKRQIWQAAGLYSFRK